MNALALHEDILSGYKDYIQSFIEIHDDDIRDTVSAELAKGKLWPSPLIQFNPAFERKCGIGDLVREEALHPELANVFHGYTLYTHQVEAIRLGSAPRSFVVTSGTGSGKSVTYLGSVFNDLFKNGLGTGVRALLVYPMNALINSQEEELRKFARNYREQTGREFPVRFAAYTGQTHSENRTAIINSPPDILLTNYMMLELLLTRHNDRSLRDSIYGNLRFLVFDELHTYRGRQGADVGMLIRRIRGSCAHPITSVGTSATMASGGSTWQQKETIARVAETVFGEHFTPEQIIGETLTRSLDPDGRIPGPDVLAAAVATVIDPECPPGMLAGHPTAIWLENKVALVEETQPDGQPALKRGTPLSLPQIAVLLAGDSGASAAACEAHLRDLLVWISRANEKLVAEGQRYTLLPFRLHQFFAQTGSVYATLEAEGKRFITLEPGVHHGGGDRMIYPHVFSRATGRTFICVSLDEKGMRLLPREFTEQVPAEDGQLVGYLIPGGSDIWNEAEDLENLPAAWLTTTKKDGLHVSKAYAGRMPRRICYDEKGTFQWGGNAHYPLQGWFMPGAPKGLLFDPTAGLFFDGNTNERTKLTTLGNEGRSTSTTVTSFLVLQGLADHGSHPKNQKLLSFTDNRQDAALQAGHFNDFVRVVRIRAAIAKAVAAAPSGTLDFKSLGRLVREALSLGLQSYARNAPADPLPHVEEQYRKTFEDYLLYQAIHDLRRGWRVILPNLEKCALLEIDYEHIAATAASDPHWQGVPWIGPLDVPVRERFLRCLLDYFRLEYAIHSDQFLEPAPLGDAEKEFGERLREPWTFEGESTFAPSALRLDKLSRREQRRTGTLGPTSAFGKFAKQFIREHCPEAKVDQASYRGFILAVLAVAQAGDLILKIKAGRAESADGEGAGDAFIYRLKLDRIIWKAGDGTTVRRDEVKLRSYKPFQDRVNTFFQRLYRTDFSALKNLVGQDHTGQLNNEARIDREIRFRADWYLDAEQTQLDVNKIRTESVSALFCSPTMELGIDIAQLGVVHMRNAPPNPANYAQRSGRAGRSGQAALVFTYCSTYSPHDRHYFAAKEALVSGVVEAPRIDLGNRELVESHLRAFALSELNLPHVRTSVRDLLEMEKEDLPLNPETVLALRLPPATAASLAGRFLKILGPVADWLGTQDWFSGQWLEKRLESLVPDLDLALDRWRTLYRDARASRSRASQQIDSGTFTVRSREYRDCENLQRQATRQIDILCNNPDTNNAGNLEMTEFYVFRYLASEGYLPGYNFTRLPVRVFVSQGLGGEYISRPRLIALREFGPGNIIYHQGDKFAVNQIILPDIPSQIRNIRVCKGSGYWLDGTNRNADSCPFTKVDLTEAKNREDFADVLPLTECKAVAREHITCEEEERRRLGFKISTYFSVPNGEMGRVRRARILSAGDHLLNLAYIPAAELIQINRGDRNRKEEGFPLDTSTGFWKPKADGDAAEPEGIRRVRVFTHTTADALYLEPLKSLALDKAGILSLQFALKRAIEQVFLIESSELGAVAMGDPAHPNIFLFEASEGSLGVLSQLATDASAFRSVVRTAIELCRFDDPDYLEKASYNDLLSYYNQPHHLVLDRFSIREALAKLAACSIEVTASGGRTYEDQYRWLRSQIDASSSTEEQFLDYLHDHRLRLPDAAQRQVEGIYVQPDFFYEPDVWVFCDGTPHDRPEVAGKDLLQRKAIEARGDEVIVYRYTDDLDKLVTRYPDVFPKVIENP